MKGYPLELRLKVLAAVDSGIPRKEVVRTFVIAMPTSKGTSGSGNRPER